MKEEVTKRALWNEGSKAGIVLGLIPVVHMFISQAVSGMQSHAVLAAVISFLLWAVKFGLCLWFMRFFMLKFADKYAVTNALTFRYGVVVALCSSLIVAAFALANVLLINPELVSTQLDAVTSMYSSMMDSNTMQAIEEIKDIMPQITFFSNLIYCFIFGVILSLIYSRNIPSRDPFAGMNDFDDQQNSDQNENGIQ